MKIRSGESEFRLRQDFGRAKMLEHVKRVSLSALEISVADGAGMRDDIADVADAG